MSQPISQEVHHRVTYPRFLLRALWLSTEGSWAFYIWLFVLTGIALVGVNAWAHQVALGMGTTGMGDHVSWGLYIANFTFLVGLAAGGVMMVVPAYLYHDRDMHDVVIVGELLAVAAIIMALLFVVADLGRPDRFWHLIPGVGRFNWPLSMLTWDVVVLNGYLLLNLHVCGYLIYTRWLGREPNPIWYVPFVLLSIVWAISIHTVTAFLYCGLGGRPFWNSALLAPRFLASAFVTGPAFIVLSLQVIDRSKQITVPPRAIETLLSIMRVTMLANLFMVASEVFTEFYTGGSHTSAARYLYFGLHGHHELVPWIWSAIALNTLAVVIIFVKPLRERRWLLNLALLMTFVGIWIEKGMGLIIPGFIPSTLHEIVPWIWSAIALNTLAVVIIFVKPLRERRWLLNLALAMTFVGIWIEKGMGLIIPGFIPSTLHEIVPYAPSMNEWRVTAGIWAFGLMVFTIALKVGLQAMTGRARWSGAPPSPVASPDKGEP